MKNLEIGWIGRLKNFRIRSKKFLNGKSPKFLTRIMEDIIPGATLVMTGP